MSEKPVILDAPAAEEQGQVGEIEHPDVPTPGDAVDLPSAQESITHTEPRHARTGSVLDSMLPEGAYLEYP